MTARQKRRLTNKDRVLKKWPEIECDKFPCFNGWALFDPCVGHSGLYITTVYSTPAQAWASAASNLSRRKK